MTAVAAGRGNDDFGSRREDVMSTDDEDAGPDAWERYVVGPGSDPDPSAWRTELSRPLAG